MIAQSWVNKEQRSLPGIRASVSARQKKTRIYPRLTDMRANWKVPDIVHHAVPECKNAPIGKVRLWCRNRLMSVHGMLCVGAVYDSRMFSCCIEAGGSL